MRRAVSLLLALVMALSLCVSAIAEPGGEDGQPREAGGAYTMDTVLAGVDTLEGSDEAKEAARNYLRQYFTVAENGDRRFVVIDKVGLRQDTFFQTQEHKAYVENTVLQAYTGDIAAVLNDYAVRYDNGTRTFSNLIGMYRSAANCPAMEINEGSDGAWDTGLVKGADQLKLSDATDGYPYNNKAYLRGDSDVSKAQAYFSQYFTYRTWETGSGDKYNTVTFRDEIFNKDTGEITDKDTARKAIADYNKLSPFEQVLLNELEIYVDGGTNTLEPFRFWRLIQRFDKQLNGGQGGNQGGGNGPTTGNVTRVEGLTGGEPTLSKAKDFLQQYITYEYRDNEYSDIHINGASIVNGMFDKVDVADAAVKAYYAMVREMEGTRSVLDNLRIRVDDQLWTFSRRMDYYKQLVDLGKSVGDSSVKTDPLQPQDTAVTMLRDSGFTAPKLGSDITITFPDPLERGRDYNYNYETVDGVGVLTVEVYKGEKQHWIEAGLMNPEGIRYTVTHRNTTNGAYHSAAAGNGNSGMWDAYANGSIGLQHYTDPTDAFGFGLAAVNVQGELMTITAMENYGDMMMLSI